ncbi:MAG: hypothetical protein LBF37_00975 [Rickettsiales bacterium]|jgi:hypothetical protein|nr:hypothetical protein [Rickettsiales bacterium]
MKVEQMLVGPAQTLVVTNVDIRFVKCPATGELGCDGIKDHFMCKHFAEVSNLNLLKNCIVARSETGGLTQVVTGAGLIGYVNSQFINKLERMVETCGTTETSQAEYNQAFQDWENANRCFLKRGNKEKQKNTK